MANVQKPSPTADPSVRRDDTRRLEPCRRLPCRVTPLGQQLRDEALALRNALYLERDRVYRALELLVRDVGRPRHGPPSVNLNLQRPFPRPDPRDREPDRRHEKRTRCQQKKFPDVMYAHPKLLL